VCLFLFSFSDIRVCVEPNPNSDNAILPFQYSVTGFKDVKCVSKENENQPDPVDSFEISFGDDSLNEIGTPNGDGINSFVFLLQEQILTDFGYDEQSFDRSLACKGTAVITTTNTRNGQSRVLDVSFGDDESSSLRRSLQQADVQESDFGMSIGIEDNNNSSAAASAHLLPLAIFSLVGAAVFVM